MLIEDGVLLVYVLRYPVNFLKAFHFQQISTTKGTSSCKEQIATLESGRQQWKVTAVTNIDILLHEQVRSTSTRKWSREIHIYTSLSLLW